LPFSLPWYFLPPAVKEILSPRTLPSSARVLLPLRSVPESELTIKQNFQMITGTLKTAGQSTAIKGRMSGDQITFKAGDAEYRGRVAADGMKGTVKARSSSGEWSATRAAS